MESCRPRKYLRDDLTELPGLQRGGERKNS